MTDLHFFINTQQQRFYWAELHKIKIKNNITHNEACDKNTPKKLNTKFVLQK